MRYRYSNLLTCKISLIYLKQLQPVLKYAQLKKHRRKKARQFTTFIFGYHDKLKLVRQNNASSVILFF